MSKVIMTFLLFTSVTLSAQQVTLSDAYLDSLAGVINSTEGGYNKCLQLEKALNQLAHSNQPKELLTERLDPSKFNKRMFLSIDAYDARRITYQGLWEEMTKYEDRKNPYILFYSGNVAFQKGDHVRSASTLKKVVEDLKELNDTFYISSAYNNLGALMWHNDKEDSALYYFLKAKEYTYWFNPMLESNILAISNVIEDSALSASQIKHIKSQRADIENPVFFNNAYQHYVKFNPSKADSIVEFLLQKYPDSLLIPDILLDAFVTFDKDREQLARSFDSTTYNAYLIQGLERLIISPVIADSIFTSDRLLSIQKKLPNGQLANLLSVFAELSPEKRNALAVSLKEMGNNNEAKLEAEAIRELYSSVQQQLVEYKSNGQKIAVVAVIIALIIFVLLQRRALNASQRARDLAKKNADLLEIQVQNLSMGNKVRDKIQESLSQQIQFSKKLQELTEYGAEHKTALIQDLNLINTYNNGVNRFKIKQICGEFYSPRFLELEGILNAIEMQVLKLTILEFKSKEIALLLDVTPQYVNNIRHRIKSALEKENIDYDQFIGELTESLIEA